MIDFTHRQISASDIDRAADCIGNNEKTRECELRQTIYGTFPYDYKIENLKDLCVTQGGIQTGPFGSQLHQEDYVDVGTPILTVEHLGENRITHNNIPRISNADRCRLAKYSLESGDIVFSRVGSVDRRALVRPAEEGWLFSGRCLRVRPDQKKLDSGYLSYFFGLDSFKKYIRSVAVGATMPSLNTAILSDIEIPHPKSLPEQRRIAHVLGTLDDKIENNRKTAKTLEAMAQAIFKSWFVDFDPVRAKMAGESGESICKRLKLTPEILDLFPDRLVDSELGEIPEGWGVGTFDDYADIVGGSTPSTNNPDYWLSGLHSWATPKDLSNLTVPVLLATENKITHAGLQQISSRLLPVGAVLLSSRAPIGYLAIAEIPVAINQGFIALKPHNHEDNIFLMLLIKQLMKEIISRANGSTFLEISKAKFRPIQVIFPLEPILNYFAALVGPCFSSIVSLEKSTQMLTAIRDTLLPKLISGEIRIPDAECKIEEATG